MTKKEFEYIKRGLDVEKAIGYIADHAHTEEENRAVDEIGAVIRHLMDLGINATDDETNTKTVLKGIIGNVNLDTAIMRIKEAICNVPMNFDGIEMDLEDVENIIKRLKSAYEETEK